MAAVDFSKISNKYPILNGKDISFLNEFFNRKEILDKFMEIENQRKKKFMMFGIIEVIFLVLSFIYFNNYFPDHGSGAVFGYIGLQLFFSFVIYMIVSMCFKDVSHAIKTEVLPKFAGSINPDLKYDVAKKYYFGDEFKLVGGKLLEYYDRIDLIEDSISFKPVITINNNQINRNTVATPNTTIASNTGLNQVNNLNVSRDINISSAGEGESGEEINGENKAGNVDVNMATNKETPYTIEGYEFKSSKKNKDKHGREYYTMNNHCYLIKITFNKARHKLTGGMSLIRDINDNLTRKIMKVITIDAMIIGFLLYATQPKKSDNMGIKLLMYIAESINVPFVIFIATLLVVMFIITWQIYSRIINEKRVKTENSEFEKEFDVYCEDQVMSRAVLTPSFMYKIFDFVNKISKHRIYEFFFISNTIYIKLDLMRGPQSNFLDVSANANITGNMKKFVEFYIELKNVTELAKELGLEYFDKSTFNNVVIK